MKITDEIAKEIWDKLIEHCGLAKTESYDLDWQTFARVLQDYFAEREDKWGRAFWPFEYRFCGALGFGGKFRHQDHDGFYINYYPEDRTPERDAMCQEINAWLKERFPEAKGWRAQTA